MKLNIDNELLYRYITDECTAGERQQVERWQRKKASNKKKVSALQKIWENEPLKEPISDKGKLWKELEKKLKKENEEDEELKLAVISLKHRFKKATSRINGWMKVAAVLLVGVLISLGYINYVASNEPDSSKEVAMREQVTDRAQKMQLTFTDGTKVSLNAGSRIRYPERFKTGRREVYLKGEAFFDVAPLNGKQFIVHTPAADIIVLGTEFNIKARAKTDKVEVVVAEGTVSVAASEKINQRDDTEVILHKNQMTTIFKGRTPLPAKQVDATKYTAWMRGDFFFDKTPLRMVLEEWHRQFNINFVVRDSSLLATSFTGEFSDESLDEMIRLVSLSLNFNYKRDGQTTIISSW